MKITISPTLLMGAFEYKVKGNSNLIFDENRYGAVTHRTKVVEIDGHILGTSQALLSYLHELVHIIDYMFSCKLSDDDVDRIAEGFAEFLVRNWEIELDWSKIKEDSDA